MCQETDSHDVQHTHMHTTIHTHARVHANRRISDLMWTTWQLQSCASERGQHISLSNFPSDNPYTLNLTNGTILSGLRAKLAAES